ncbi:TPA: insulinase family protein [Pseudomonas putida]|nr:insulinase family protein [Pseudomonas putida]
MTHDHTLTTPPLLCDGPATDTAVAAMTKLQSAHDIELGKIPPLQAEAQQWQTREGARVSFIASHDRPMFDLSLRFRAGSVLDGPEPGLAALVLYSLDQGTEQLEAADFAAQIEGLGAVLETRLKTSSALITLRCLSLPSLRNSVMQLLTDMLAHPAFRTADVDKIRERLAFLGSAQARGTINRLLETTNAHVFKGHPYATASIPADISKFTGEQLRAFHQRAYSASNLDIGLVGNLTREEAEDLVGKLVRALPQQWVAQDLPPVAPHSPLVRHIERSSTTTRGMLTISSNVTAGDMVYPALTLLDAILGGGYESRLIQELRVRRGLTYAIYSSLTPHDAGSLLHILWDVAPQYRDGAAALISSIMRCLGDRGPSQAECDMALNQLAGQLHKELLDKAKLAKALATYSHHGLPGNHLATYLDKLGTLTPGNLREAAQVWLRNAPEVFVSIGADTEQLPLPEPASVDQ